MSWMQFPTLTLWAACGRPTNGHSYHEWDGVVCMGSEEETSGKVSWGHPYMYCTYGQTLTLHTDTVLGDFMSNLSFSSEK